MSPSLPSTALSSASVSSDLGSYTPSIARYSILFADIYDRLLGLAQQSSDIRFVAISRRGYPGSTPFGPDEIANLTTGDDHRKESFLRARGSEVAIFIDKFIQEFHLPPVSADGHSGGIALMGWSLGCSVALSVVSHMDTYPQRVQTRLGAYLRTLILHGK